MYWGPAAVRSVDGVSLQVSAATWKRVRSGTTAVACARHGREFVGYEINADYHGIAQQRVAGVRPIPVVAEPATAVDAASIEPG